LRPYLPDFSNQEKQKVSAITVIIKLFVSIPGTYINTNLKKSAMFSTMCSGRLANSRVGGLSGSLKIGWILNVLENNP
jgi:hypothetical protein